MAVPVLVNSEQVRTLDWSVGGFRLPAPLHTLDQGQAVAEMAIPAEGLVFHFFLSIEHIHANADQTFAGYRFVDMGEEQHDLLRALVVSVVTDECYPLEDLLQLPFVKDALREARQTGQSMHPRLGFAISRV
jgi:hypothetical protein